MIVVADASPLIYLSVLGGLEVLRALYGTVLVPRAVSDEVVVAGEGEPGSREVASPSWIEVREVVLGASWGALEARLDPGEAAAIVLALEFRADLLVVVDQAGRREATAAGLRIHGTLGILVEAHRKGLVMALGPEVDALVLAGSGSPSAREPRGWPWLASEPAAAAGSVGAARRVRRPEGDAVLGGGPSAARTERERATPAGADPGRSSGRGHAQNLLAHALEPGGQTERARQAKSKARIAA